MKAEGITIVGASAGSGKTYRLTREVTEAVAAGSADRVELPGLVAVTFTKKAHVELEARIREKLVQEEAFEEALQLPLAYVGTVHAAALRLLQEFALDAGLSPNVDVIAGNETKLLRQAFERSLDEGTRQRLVDLAQRLELRIDHRTGRTDWVTPVADIMDLARSNRIAPEALRAMAERSVDGLLALLPTMARDGAALDTALAGALEEAERSLAAGNDGRKNTADALKLLARARERLADGELRWSDWAKLATVAPSKACERHVLALREVAARYEEHPRLHVDLREITLAIFDAARAGLVAYRSWKEERRVVDYVDMLDRALDLVDHPRVREELARRLRFVVVDEFQDTSPIQLALFMRLHTLAERSVWVGDRKQCIFEYAGADPVLMDSVSAWVEREGGRRDRLSTNRRSRPALVHACSELFSAALARHGFSAGEVAVSAYRPDDARLAPLPPLGVWVVETANKGDDAEAVAEGVRRLLERAAETPIIDRTTGEARPVRPGDVAVLVTTNEGAANLANALHARGVRSAIARAGLFETPEGTLLDAALRWLLDGRDRLSAAVVDALLGWRGQDPDAWLSARIREVDVAAGEAAEEETAPSWQAKLDEIRVLLTVLAPAEALDATIDRLDIARVCARWPDPAQRVANLDAVRGAALAYEARCAQEREAATLAGLLRYFDTLRAPTLQRDEILPSDDQHVPADEAAVVVCTYHKSKGLEWPVVVLTSLDRRERRNAFEVTPESTAEAFDPDAPLANRGIRYWPWPLGTLQQAGLAERAERSHAGCVVAEREDKERARLLYVGFTRARDHLVLAARVSKGAAKTAWLDVLADEAGVPLLKLPATADDGTVAETEIRCANGELLRVSTRVARLGADGRAHASAAPTLTWFERPARASTELPEQLPSYRISPSADVLDWPELTAMVAMVAQARIGTVERLSSAVVLEGTSYASDELGTAVHNFLAADVDGLSVAARHGRARALLDGANLGGVVRPEALVAASDAFREWVALRWPGAVWHREIPIDGVVSSEHGERRVVGIIDLLLELPDSFVLVDHKTFPARSESAWRKKCAGFIPQLAAYASVVNAAGAKQVRDCWIHLPVGGGVVQIKLHGGGDGKGESYD